MKVTKIKNLVIWALVLIDIFFLAFVLVRLCSERSNKAESLRDLGALFGQSGITLDIKNIREGIDLQAYTVHRDPMSEQALVDALLGPSEKTDKGGNIYNYTGEKGSAVFYSGGDFEVTFKPGARPAGPDLLSDARKMLKLMKLDGDSAVKTSGKEGKTVTAVCVLNSQPIFNCGISLTFGEGSLLQISGKMAAAVTPVPGMTNMTSSATALVKFLGNIKSGRIECTRITAVEAGYYLPPFTGEDSLIVVWRIETNAGIYYIDAVAGDLVGA